MSQREIYIAIGGIIAGIILARWLENNPNH